MGWTPPRTWSAGETVTSSIMNIHIRDNLNVVKTQIRDSGLLRILRFAKSDTGSGNSGTGETDLAGFSFSMLAGELASPGDGYTFRLYGPLGATGNTKTLRIDIAGQKVILLQTTQNGGYFYAEFGLTYYSASVCRITGGAYLTPSAGGAATWSSLITSMSSLNFAVGQTCKFTGQGGASNDIVLHHLTVAVMLT